MKKVFLPILVISILMSLGGCRLTPKDSESFSGAENEAEIIPLTAEELELYNKTFENLIYDEQGNPTGGNKVVTQFFTSYYSRPQDISLGKLLEHFPSDYLVTDEAEFEAIKTKGPWPFVNMQTLDSMVVPIHKFPADIVNNALEKYMGITLEDLSGVGTEHVNYVEEFDAYYNFTSDGGCAFFFGVSGEKQGDIVRLYGEDATLTLKLRDDGFWFLSHEPVGDAS